MRTLISFYFKVMFYGLMREVFGAIADYSNRKHAYYQDNLGKTREKAKHQIDAMF